MKMSVKWVLLALSLSLMINVFAAGHIIGQRRSAPPGEGAGAWVSRIVPKDIQGQIPQEARQAFRQDMMANRRSVRDARMTLKEARARIPALLDQETLDPEELKAALSDIRGATTQLQSHFESALSAALVTMTPEQRRLVAKRMLERSKGLRGRLQRERQAPPPPEAQR